MKREVKAPLACLTLAAVLGGCQSAPTTQTTDPYTGETKTSNTVKGAGIGAVAGAVLGAVTADKGDKRGKRILAGALAGGAVGGGIGYYMDQQEAELRRHLEGTGVRVQRIGNQIQLVMPGNITFRTGSADLAGNFLNVLDGVATVLKKYSKTQLNVDGHTDSVGSESLNQSLSERRAQSVAFYLADQGIDRARIRAIGYGESRPVASNGTSEGRAANRRVELWIQPLS